jgi:hypothetical protein
MGDCCETKYFSLSVQLITIMYMITDQKVALYAKCEKYFVSLSPCFAFFPTVVVQNKK